MLLVGFMSIKNGVELIRAGYSTAFWVGFAVLGCIMSFCLQGVVDYPLMSPKLICNFMMLVGITERAIHLYSGREIAMRRALRKRLRKRLLSPQGSKIKEKNTGGQFCIVRRYFLRIIPITAGRPTTK